MMIHTIVFLVNLPVPRSVGQIWVVRRTKF